MKSQAFSLVDQNLKFYVSRGKHSIRTRLDDDEIDLLFSTEMDDPILDLSRDLYAFQVLTGVSYKDLRTLTWSQNVRKNRKDYWLEGLRKKTGEYYSPFLVPEAVDLILKYRDANRDLLFNAPNIWTQNRRLKLVALACKIKKRITTHTGRHTFASAMIRGGMSLSAIRDSLGHVQVETTEEYARLERDVIKREMLRARNKRKK